MGNKQIKAGVILSYILIIINALYGLFLTPYMLSKLGEAEFGVYKTITSLSSSLMVLDLGIGGTVMRYVASYKAKKQDGKIPNFLFSMFIQAFALCVVVGIVGVIVGSSLDSIYSNTFTSSQIHKAKQLFAILIINMAFHILENVANGIITGCNRFIFANGLKLVRLITRIFLIYFLLGIIDNSIVIVCIDLAITVSLLVIELLYVYLRLRLKIKFSFWDKSVFLESGKYTILMFLTSFAAQVNNNLDNVIIGALKGPELVSIYSMGLLIFAMYENLSTSVSGVMLPTVSNIIEDKDSSEKLNNLIIKVGRIQFSLLGAAVVGFVCLGKQFINLWLGDKYTDVYIITLILMIPSLFELCVNVCLSILRAKNMLSFRTIILFSSTVLNGVVTVLFVKYWSYIGAAIGTATSFVVGSLIIMNIYYYRRLGLNMINIYLQILRRIWLCLGVSGAVLYISSGYIFGSWISFVINVLIFVIVYSITMILFGLSKDELATIPVLNKFLRRNAK